MWTIQLVWLLQTSNGCQTVTIETKNLALATNPCDLTGKNVNRNEKKKEKAQTEREHQEAAHRSYFIDYTFPQNTGPTVTFVMVFLLLFSLVAAAEVCACHRVPVEGRGQLADISWFFPSHGSCGSNSGHQGWCLSTEWPCQPTVISLFVASICVGAMFETEEPDVAQPFGRWGQVEGSEVSRANSVIGKFWSHTSSLSLVPTTYFLATISEQLDPPRVPAMMFCFTAAPKQQVTKLWPSDPQAKCDFFSAI